MDTERLKLWLHELWVDPVGSKLISAPILSIPSGLAALLSADLVDNGIARAILWVIVAGVFISVSGKVVCRRPREASS